MKRLILFELIILFLATTFESDSPPGWFQQVLPVNDFINDIFFLDSSTGWVVTAGASSGSDSGYVMKTTDGGNAWIVQYNPVMNFNAVQFVNINTGYTAGGNGFGRFYKTTNSGLNWTLTTSFGFITIKDLFFVNNETGWICSDDPSAGGVFKTTNSGVNWQPQLGASSFPKKLFFLNQDTGWVICQDTKLLRTTNAGLNWEQQYVFPQQINDIYFVSSTLGLVASGMNHKTSNGGFNWTVSNLGGTDLYFASDSIAWSATTTFQRINKSTNGGTNWFSQSSPIAGNENISGTDTINAWAGSTGIVHTTDGGGPPVGILYASSDVSNYKLDQNFPNPFNPTTLIFFKLQEKSTVELLVYSILGKEVAEMVDDDHFTAGVYQFGFDASKYDLPSGVYFYRLTAQSEVSDNIFIDTKKMIFIK